jgi:hypothetical protein
MLLLYSSQASSRTYTIPVENDNDDTSPSWLRNLLVMPNIISTKAADVPSDISSAQTIFFVLHLLALFVGSNMSGWS